MAWNPKQAFAHSSFCELVYKEARATMRGDFTESIGGFRYLPYWWINREVRVYWEAVIPRRTVDLIVNAVEQRSREAANLSFIFLMMGSHESAIAQIEASTVDNEVDERHLFSLALSEHWRDARRGGRQHADIYITSRPFLNDPVSWAAASFKHGTMVYCLNGKRHADAGFLHRVALHETNHLLGMSTHCDDFQNVAGLPYTRECNMHYSCSHSDICPKCLSYINVWWQGVRDESRMS